jgi:hypothetical protein
LLFRPLFAINNAVFAAVGVVPVAAFGFYGVKSLGGPWATQGPRLGRNGLSGLFQQKHDF